ncbi:MAG: HDOD domain-containing protein [Syntrophorhabdaceae bacterium]|nr:HDOD domain-containing protein [Syntrophorhabdaceae bacterium]
MTRQRLLSKTYDLKLAPSMKCIIDRTIETIVNPNSSIMDILKIIEIDPSLSAKILGIANSAYYNRGTNTYDLHHALIKIGFDEIKNIIFCLLVVDNLLKVLKIRFSDLLEFWRHSIYVAHSARILAEKTLDDEPQKAYIVSLLHDIGKIVFYSEIEDYSKIVHEAKERQKPIWETERELFAIDHQEIGYVIAKKWRLPETVCSVIGNHHDLTNSENNNRNLLKITILVDNFFYCKDTNGSPEKLILLKEKDNIKMEVKKNMEIININFQGVQT